ncbi:MAG: PilZ domain-containing protein [Rhodocyclaceae bacterium]
MENYLNRRLDRRIPLGSSARIRFEDGSEVEALCVELSVRGMTLQTGYVPGEGEELEVIVDAPAGKVETPPLHVRLAVKRCISIDDGRYELGGEIVKVLA